MSDSRPPRATAGRGPEAARNDGRILAAARAVFVADPEAPVAAVARRAGVGIGALYRRYRSKEDLLRALCAEGLARYIAAAEAAIADQGDPGAAFARFMGDVVEGDATSLTRRLAVTFTPSPELFAAAEHAGRLNDELFSRAQAAGAIRPDADVNDLGLVLEQLAALTLGDERRTREIRRRYLALALGGLRAAGPPLPGPAPSADELAARWTPREK